MPNKMSEDSVVNIKDDDDSIDDEQLAEFQEMVEELGSFPDKVKINSLSWIAEDYCDSESSAGAIYRIIRQRLMNTSRDNLLPVVYVIDSILKNVKGLYLNILEKDAIEWMPIVFQKLDETQRLKLEKVWKTWDEFKLFPQESWKAIGRCFVDRASTTHTTSSSTISEVAGITRTKDGTLILPGNLRKEMQSILDDIYNGMQNELEKVSLERLADIDPNLLLQIKTTAEESMRSIRTQMERTQKEKTDSPEERRLPSFFTETRSPQTINAAKAWQQLKTWKPVEQTQELMTKLQKVVLDGGSSDNDKRYTREEALQMTQYFATASATGMLLTSALARVKQVDSHTNNNSSLVSKKINSLSVSGGSFAVNRNEFTNEGIKKKNEAVIGLLYEIGLPYVSSADGRRFRTQVELSKHLDALFKRNQLEKAMARTEERGWFQSDILWIRRVYEDELKSSEGNAVDPHGSSELDDENNENATVPADESRDHCAICGLKFKMYFDNDDGIYRYSNCKEIEVLNDDAAESESDMKLIHHTCWKGLGSPEILTFDQTLQDDF